MRLLLVVLFVTGAVDAILHQPPTPSWSLQNLANFELKAASYLKTVVKEKANFIQRFESRFLKLASARSSGMSRDDYINNPLPALVLMRRLVEDWTPLAWMVREHYELSQLGLGAVRWPSDKDVALAAIAVMRTQFTYNLDISSLASGAADNYGAFNVTGDSKSARSTLIVLFRKHPKLKCMHQEEIIKAYTDMSMLNCSKFSSYLEDQRKEGMYKSITKNDLELHSRLCRGEVQPDSRLVCRYVHYQQPHLRLQPFKLEELQLDPPVLRFYDVITDRETKVLKKSASKKMIVSETENDDGDIVVSLFRTSYSASIDVNNRLSQRMGEMSQLNHETAERDQMASYSVSGEYLPHVDYFHNNKSSGSTQFLDDRIATLMFYINEVKEGGNTVFMKWNLTVKPVKNSAVLWFNYLPNGEPDSGSLHSGCPVLQGTKWVITKWFLNEGNEFKKPCGLHPDDSFRSYYLE